MSDREKLQAVILAAGRGNRLLPYTKDRPKCLLDVGERTIIEHQIQSLRLAGVDRIQVVTGYNAELVRETCADRTTYAHNAAYDSTNSFDSLGCAVLDSDIEGLVVMNSDVIFHPRLLEMLLSDPRGNVLLADFDSELGEEEMKIIVDEEDRITQISKAIDPRDGDAENLGVLKLTAEVAGALTSLARNREEKSGISWVPDGINHLSAEFEFYTCRSGGIAWTEIDYIHDLERARQVVYPQIHEALWGASV